MTQSEATQLDYYKAQLQELQELIYKLALIINDVDQYCHKLRDRIVENEKSGINKADHGFSMIVQDIFQKSNILHMELLLYT